MKFQDKRKSLKTKWFSRFRSQIPDALPDKLDQVRDFIARQALEMCPLEGIAACRLLRLIAGALEDGTQRGFLEQRAREARWRLPDPLVCGWVYKSEKPLVFNCVRSKESRADRRTFVRALLCASSWKHLSAMTWKHTQGRVRLFSEPRVYKNIKLDDAWLASVCLRKE